jgi:hypothetical protein
MPARQVELPRDVHQLQGPEHRVLHPALGPQRQQSIPS